MKQIITSRTINQFIGKRCRITFKDNSSVIATINEYVRRNIITDSDSYYYDKIKNIEIFTFTFKQKEQ